MPEKVQCNTKITIRKHEHQYLELSIEEAEDIYVYLNTVLNKTTLPSFQIKRSS